MSSINNIRCIVVDDEYLSAKLVADYVRKTHGLILVLQTTVVTEALELVQKGAADLIFLDIEMPEITGLQFMKIIGDNCKAVFTTAYPDYAVDSYEYNAVDYLLKPITFERFLIAVKKARERLEHRDLIFAPAKKNPNHIFIKTAYRLQKIDLSSIYYIEGLRDYIAVHTSASKILTLEKMKNIEVLLPSDQFIRIHKSFIVNKSKIDFINRGRVVVNNIYLPVGDTYKDRLIQELGI